MVEGFYRGWDEIRTVPNGTQSGLRVIVLFTDGASNGVPGAYDASPGTAKSFRTWDFPKNLPDPDNQTHDAPHIDGLYDTGTGEPEPRVHADAAQLELDADDSAGGVSAAHDVAFAPSAAASIPTSFPLQTAALNVNGAPQNVRRGLRNMNGATGRYPADVFNVNNAARNVLEIIANAARSDAAGDYPIRIYTIGMGALVRYDLGTMPEKPEDILKRISNDRSSPDFNPAQLEGKYFFAEDEGDVGPAFQGIQNQILRLTR